MAGIHNGRTLVLARSHAAEDFNFERHHATIQDQLLAEKTAESWDQAFLAEIVTLHGAKVAALYLTLP